MLKIRLIRIGKKNAPAYRVVLAEKQAPVKGRFLEVLGNYNPRLKEISFKKERVLHWLSKGAQASDTVHNLLVSQGIIDEPKRKRKMKVKKKEEASGEEKAEQGAIKAEEKVEKTEVKEDKSEAKPAPNEKPEDDKKEEKAKEKAEEKPKS